ncbi:hypothetical protein ACWEO1_22545 [Kitasatospora cineracea]
MSDLIPEDELDEDDLYDEEDDSRPDFTDADAFFAEEVADVEMPVLRFFGTDYRLPPRVPLTFNLLMARNAEEESIESLAETLAPLFGRDALDDWLAKGVDDRMLGIVLGWAIANIRKPGTVDLVRAAQIYDEKVAREAEGKARNRAERRARSTTGSGPRSSNTGRSSKRT